MMLVARCLVGDKWWLQMLTPPRLEASDQQIPSVFLCFFRVVTVVNA